MSGFDVGLSLLTAEVPDILSVVFATRRNIGGFEAQVTIEETHHDTTRITKHPVEVGAEVSDHAINIPPTVTIRVGYSNSSLKAFGNPRYVQDVYQNFLALRATLEPFQIITGKRRYQNMLITGLTVVTDQKTENALMLTVECEELLFTVATTVAYPSNNVQKNPEVTGAPAVNGSKQLEETGVHT